MEKSKTLKDLKGFIRLAIWNQYLILYYTKYINPLQHLKTRLLQ